MKNPVCIHGVSFKGECKKCPQRFWIIRTCTGTGMVSKVR